MVSDENLSARPMLAVLVPHMNVITLLRLNAALYAVASLRWPVHDALPTKR
jgi:hypothetical protein